MPSIEKQSKYKRILLKLSGEALMGEESFGIDSNVLNRMALEIGQLVGIGVQVGMVIGGGNLFRGAALNAAGLDRQEPGACHRHREAEALQGQRNRRWPGIALFALFRRTGHFRG